MKIIGILHSGSPEAMGEQFAEFHGGLRRAGYVDGQNVTIEYRWANDDYPARPLATELIRLPVSVLVAAGGTVSALAARDAAKEQTGGFRGRHRSSQKRACHQSQKAGRKRDWNCRADLGARPETAGAAPRVRA